MLTIEESNSLNHSFKLKDSEFFNRILIDDNKICTL
jgi:hypothetical protein